MKTIEYTLYRIAGLDFLVEKGLLDHPGFANFLPFKHDKEQDANPVFTVRKGDIPGLSEKPTAEQLLDYCRYQVWIGEGVNIIEFKHIEEPYIFRLKADKNWENIVLDIDRGETNHRVMAVSGLIMAAFTYRAAFFDAVMMHASTVKQGDWAVAFTGPSGAGKSTHSQLWLQFIDGTSLLNDDQPVVRIIDEKPYLFGSPWSGKTPCYKNEMAPMRALFRMVQAKENNLTPMQSIELFSSLLSSCAFIKEDVLTFGKISQTIATLCGMLKGYTLESRPEKEAALLTYDAAVRG